MRVSRRVDSEYEGPEGISILLLRSISLQSIDGRPVYLVSDHVNHIECQHLSELERRVALGSLLAPESSSGVQLIQRKADEHEKRYLAQLRYPAWRPRRRVPDSALEAGVFSVLVDADAATFEAMASGAPAIYQPTWSNIPGCDTNIAHWYNGQRGVFIANKRSKYTDTSKKDVAEQVLFGGKTAAEVSAASGVEVSSIYGWVQEFRAATAPGSIFPGQWQALEPR